MKEAGIHLSTAMFFESVPDEFVDIKLDKWHFDEATHTIPIIIPRNYLNLYNLSRIHIWMHWCYLKERKWQFSSFSPCFWGRLYR